MAGVAAAIGGAAVLGTAATLYASDQASSAQRDAANTASGTQMSMYNQTRADQTPWRQSGQQALGALDAWYGLPGMNGTSQTGGYAAPPANGLQGMIGGGVAGLINQRRQANSAQGQPAQTGPTQASMTQQIQQQPGYQFQMDQGSQALQRSMAARGLLNSGAAAKALTQYGQGYASSAAENYLNGLRSMAGLGQVATQATGQAGMNAANQIGANQIYGGNAAAAGYANQSNAINGGLNGLVSAIKYQPPNNTPNDWSTPNASAATSMNLGLN